MFEREQVLYTYSMSKTAISFTTIAVSSGGGTL